MISLLWLCATIAAINRVRGGGCSFFTRLPGHARFYAAALVAAVSFVPAGPVDAGLAGLCFLAWSWMPWGRWYDLGALEGDPDREETWFEAIVRKVSRGHDSIAFLIRNLVGLVPAAILLHPAFLLLAGFQTAAYGIGWRWGGVGAIRLAELLTGAVWGVFIWALL